MSNESKVSAEVNGSEPFAEARGWVAAESAGPDMGRLVMVWTTNNGMMIAKRETSQGAAGRWGWFRPTGGLGLHPSDVTHWMPLPEPPNSELSGRRPLGNDKTEGGAPSAEVNG